MSICNLFFVVCSKNALLMYSDIVTCILNNILAKVLILSTRPVRDGT